MTINPRTSEAYKLLHKGTLVFARAEQQGIRVDVTYAERKKKRLGHKIIKLEEQFKRTKFYRHWAHVNKKPNIYSNPQLAHFLYQVKKLTPAKLTITGQGSTDEESLLRLNIPELENLLEIRKLKKVRDTYLDSFIREQVNGYIHPFFNLNLVRTFRSSSDHPNFQNIPIRDKICRKALYARPGHQLLEVDYSGLEVRIAACYHEDPTMLRYIHNPASDMHKDMAEQIFMIKLDRSNPEHNILRSAAKNGFVFPEFYGDYYKNCAEGLACHWGQLPHGTWKDGQGIPLNEGTLSDHLRQNNIKSLKSFTNHLKEIEYDFWNNRFPGYKRWKERWWRLYQKYGYVDLKTGFRCSGLMNRKEVTNYPIQGAAFHCLLWSFIELDKVMREEEWDTRLVGQIHDSIVLDVNPEELNRVKTIVKKITCESLPKAWNWIIVPLDIKMDLYPVDGSWADKSESI